MSEYASLPKNELEEMKSALQKQYDDFKAKGLKLNMARGKPGAEQLNLSMGLLGCVGPEDCCRAEDGTDCRNYGVLDGLPEAKRLFADILGVSDSNIIVGGNSSLNLMYDSIARSFTHGVLGSTPWGKLDKIRFLCPVPGYDRHFGITEHFGIEMVNIDMTSDGPDMDMVERLASADDSIKGIWCVPKYSNPLGTTYSDEVVERFAKLKPAAGDFRIYWDNAYCIHHLTDTPDRLKNILAEARKYGNEDIVYIFASTSKVTFPGSGVSVIAASENNIQSIKSQIKYQTLGYDKINQLRHVRYFKNYDGIKAHMKKHAAIMKPKFDVVLGSFEKELSGTGIADWTKPNGGYFISFNALDGCAARIVKLCKEAGVILTPAGATFPYGKDPRDRNIRIAPSYPPVDELKLAISLFCVCVKLVSLDRLLQA